MAYLQFIGLSSNDHGYIWVYDAGSQLGYTNNGVFSDVSCVLHGLDDGDYVVDFYRTRGNGGIFKSSHAYSESDKLMFLLPEFTKDIAFKVKPCKAFPPDLTPVLEIPSFDNYTAMSGITTLTATATDDQGIQRVEFYIDNVLRFTDLKLPYSYDWDTRYFDDGRHSLKVRAVDTAGNESFAKSSLTVYQTRGPSLMIYDDSLASGWSANGRQMTSSLNNPSLVYRGDYSIKCLFPVVGGNFILRPDSPLVAGDYEALQFFVRGSAGGEILSPSLEMTTGEQYGKWLDETHLEGGSVSNSEWKAVRFKFDEHHVPKSSWIESIQIGSPTGDIEVYLDEILFTLSPPPVFKDNPPPVTINSPADGTSISGFTRVSVSATDDNGIDRVEFYVDGTLRQMDDTGPGYRFGWDTTTETLGMHALQILAYDTVGQNAVDEATVEVLEPDPNASSPFPVEDFETGDFSSFNWQRYGSDAYWPITSDVSNGDLYSAQAGSINDNESSSLRLTYQCKGGEISFFLKVSSESGYDYLQFYIDGEKQEEWSGEEDWVEVSFLVSPGTRTFEWVYEKDSSASTGEDTAWIDDIVFPMD